MPEIWLVYGETEIILDIKYENILKIASPIFETMTYEKIQTAINDNAVIEESTLILFMTPFQFMLPIIKAFHDQLIERKINSWEICIVSSPLSQRTRHLVFDEKINITRISSDQINDKISTFQNIILVDKLEYDPVFGFGGTHSRFIRKCRPEVMNEIYPTVIGKIPLPGQQTEPLKIAMENAAKIGYQMINVISDKNGIDSLHFGNSIESFLQSVSQFKLKSTVEGENSKSGIFSGGTNYNIQKSLGESMNILWNNIHTISQNGTIILLSENREGIGSGALSRYVEGRLDLVDLNKHNYMKDMEHLNFLQLFKDKIEIMVISTIPSVYLDKLGIRSLPKIKDGLEYLLKKNGKYHKVNIIPFSDITSVSCSGRL
jgi:hypothetical protein